MQKNLNYLKKIVKNATRLIFWIKEYYKRSAIILGIFWGIIGIVALYFTICGTDLARVKISNVEHIMCVYSGDIKDEYVRLEIFDVVCLGKNFKFHYSVSLPFNYKGEGELEPKCRLDIFSDKLATIMFDNIYIGNGDIYIYNIDGLNDIQIIFPGKGKLRKATLYKNHEK